MAMFFIILAIVAYAVFISYMLKHETPGAQGESTDARKGADGDSAGGANSEADGAPSKAALLDKGMLSHFPDYDDTAEHVVCYCVAKEYPLYNSKNESHWFLLTDRHIRIRPRASTVGGFLSKNEYFVLNTADYAVCAEKHEGVQFYPEGGKPVKHKAGIPFFIHGAGAIGGAIGAAASAAINRGRNQGVVLYFKYADYCKVINFFRDKPALQAAATPRTSPGATAVAPAPRASQSVAVAAPASPKAQPTPSPAAPRKPEAPSVGVGQLSEQEAALVKGFRQLSEVDKSRIIVQIADMTDK